MRISSRSAVDPFIVMDVMEAAQQRESEGHSIIHMEVGQPGTGAPTGAIKHLSTVMQSDPMGYTVAMGRPDLRGRISQLYRDWYGLDIAPERIAVTAGSSAAFQLAFIACFDQGAKVAIGDPGYPSYRNILKALDLQPIGIQTSEKNRYQPTPEDLAAEPDLQGLLVASPSNPTGTMLDHSAMEGLISTCANRGMDFISDEIYHGIQYDSKAVSALEISDDVIVINSFSKYFSMTGWRVGWLVVPESHVRVIERLAQNMFICAPHVSQIAACAAMDCQDELKANLAVYRDNRALMLEGLPQAGFHNIAPPDGAFYIYADVSDLTDDSRILAREILEGAGVSVTPGLDFDPKRGLTSLRFSYARAHSDIVEGLKRLKDFMDQRKK